MKKTLIYVLCLAIFALSGTVLADMDVSLFMEDWENSGSTHYPTGWSHTGSGDAGVITAGVGIGGSKAMRLVGEGTGYDGYYRDVASLPAGRVEFHFAIENVSGTIAVCNIGETDLDPRFDLLINDTSANFFYIGNGYNNIDTGIAKPGTGEWAHIVYEWYEDNSDYLEINGTEITIPAHWSNHRAYGGYPPNSQLVVERFRFGVQSTGSIAIWDNIEISEFQPYFGYFDFNLFGDVSTGPNDMNYVNIGNARSLYEIQKHNYEGRNSYIFLQYFPPRNPYTVTQQFTDILDAVGQFTEPEDVEFIFIGDEYYLSGITKTEAETMLAHAKSRLPGYKFALSFGALNNPAHGPGGTGANVEGRGGFPDNLDLAILNWAPYGRIPAEVPADKNAFDTDVNDMLIWSRNLADPNLEFIFDAGIYVNQATSDANLYEPNSIEWFADWVDSESDIVGMLMYSWYGSPGEYAGKWLEDNFGGLVDAQRRVGDRWGISTSLTPPEPNYPVLPSSFDRQKFNTGPSHEGWDSLSGGTPWFGIFGEQSYSGVQSMRVRNNNHHSYSASRPVPSEANVHGELDMYVKVTNLAGTSGMQVLALFPGYTDGLMNNGVNGSVSGTQTMVLTVENGESNYLLVDSVNPWPTDTGFPITGNWDNINVKWDVSGTDYYTLSINEADSIAMGSLYSGNVTQIQGIRALASQDGTIAADPPVYDPPVGNELWYDDVEIAFSEEMANNSGFFETWEFVVNTTYPRGWTHTGGGTVGLVTDAVGVAGSTAMRLVGEGAALDGYYRSFTPTREGIVEFDFAVENAGSMEVMAVVKQDWSQRFYLLTSGTTYKYLYAGYAEIDTGISLPGAGQWHHVKYSWNMGDNSDELIINGTVVPIPAGRQNHRINSTDNSAALDAGLVRFGVSGTGVIGIWDNILMEPGEIEYALIEDWEAFSAGSVYPAGWYTGSATGAVTAGAGIGGSQALRITSGGSGTETYGLQGSRQFSLEDGRIEFDWTINSLNGTIMAMNIGSPDFSTRMQLYALTSTNTYWYTGGPSWNDYDTGISLPTGGAWHHVVYLWNDSNSPGTDELIINGTSVPLHGGEIVHRPYNNSVVMENFRFGTQSAGSIATWDNIVLKIPIRDLTGDGWVRMVDLDVLLGEWLADDCDGDDTCSGADFDDSGVINFADFVELAARWLD